MAAPAPLRHALASGRVEFIKIGENSVVPVRIFGAQGEGLPILFTHGLQSHSGWFAQSAAFLAGLGHPVYAMDRMGSGLSPAVRGDAQDFMQWVEEIEGLAATIMTRHGRQKFYLVGHCFGAIPATAYAATHPERLQALILTTPAIYTTTTIPLGDMLNILLSPSGARDFSIPVPLDPESFSELPEYQKFIANDQLSLRAATGDFYYQVYRARKYIEQNVEQLRMPVLMVLAGEDRICDNPRNRQFFFKIPAGEKTLTEFADARHILEFSPEQQPFFSALAGWLTYR